MANPTTGRGFRPVAMIGGRPFTGGLTAYPIASGYGSAIALGDPVILANTGKLNVAGVGVAIRGIFMGVSYRDSTGAPVVKNNWVASTTTFGSEDAVALVADDPDTIFEARVLNLTSAVTQAAMGNTVDGYNIGSADSNGVGGAGIDGSALTATNKVWRMLRFAPLVGNETDTANPLVWVQPALHELRQTAGV